MHEASTRASTACWGGLSLAKRRQLGNRQQTASSDTSIDITSGIDSTYDVYVIEFINLHPSSDSVDLKFQGNASGQTGFNEVVTNARAGSRGKEVAIISGVDYDGLAGSQSAGDIHLSRRTGADADQAVSGNILLFRPADTTSVTMWQVQHTSQHAGQWWNHGWTAGYFNVAAAIDEISIYFSSGTIQTGKIKLYGIGGA